MPEKHFIGDRPVSSNGLLRGSKDSWPLIWDRMIPVVDGGKLLDVGCGEHVWSTPGWTVFRCDNFEEYPKEKRRLAKNIRDVDLNNNWPYKKKVFDGVAAVDVIEHLENPWHFFREATRIARRFIIIATPNTTSEVSKAIFERYGRFWSFTESAVKSSHHITPIFLWQIELAAEKCGWTVDEVAYTNTDFYCTKDCRDVSAVIQSQPGKRNVVIRVASPLFLKEMQDGTTAWGKKTGPSGKSKEDATDPKVAAKHAASKKTGIKKASHRTLPQNPRGKAIVKTSRSPRVPRR